MDNISITFADGETVSFPAIAEASVLVSAERAGTALAHNCRTGICRTCAARGADGRDVLLCREPAASGFAASVSYRRADVTPATMRRAKINRFGKISRSVWEIRCRLQFPLAFLPGQFVEVIIPGLSGPKRFSMASLPADKEHILHVRDFAEGEMSGYLGTRARPEDGFAVRGPFGTFYLRQTARPKLFISGGTGLAPILAMLKSLDASAPPLAIVAGFQTAEDAYAMDELTALAMRLPLEVIVTADRADASWPGRVGNPVAALGDVKTVPLDAGAEAYLCGPPGMVTAAKAALIAHGLTPSDIYNEEFVHAATG